MDLFIYSDESGVFDKVHNEIFVYGGLIFLGKEEKDDYNRKYLTAEKAVRCGKYSHDEMKGIELLFCDSNKVTLIRAADIVANRIYFMALNRKLESMEGIYLSTLP